MEAIDPRIRPDLVPEGSKPRVMGAGQQHVQPLPSIKTPNGCVITRWRPNEAERRMIFDGADVFVAVHTYNQPQQPISVNIGYSDNIDWRDN